MNILRHSDSEVVFYSGAFESKFRERADELPQIKYFIGIDLAPELADGRFVSREALMAKGEELLEAGDDSYLSLESDDAALKMLVYTSGTTGVAKGVMLSLHNSGVERLLRITGVDGIYHLPVGIALSPHL